VAFGYSVTILTSSDGTTWDNRTSGTSYVLPGGTYGNSIFVTVGDIGTILTSSDAITWTSGELILLLAFGPLGFVFL